MDYKFLVPYILVLFLIVPCLLLLFTGGLAVFLRTPMRDILAWLLRVYISRPLTSSQVQVMDDAAIRLDRTLARCVRDPNRYSWRAIGIHVNWYSLFLLLAMVFSTGAVIQKVYYGDRLATLKSTQSKEPIARVSSLFESLAAMFVGRLHPELGLREIQQEIQDFPAPNREWAVGYEPLPSNRVKNVQELRTVLRVVVIPLPRDHRIVRITGLVGGPYFEYNDAGEPTDKRFSSRINKARIETQVRWALEPLSRLEAVLLIGYTDTRGKDHQGLSLRRSAWMHSQVKAYVRDNGGDVSSVDRATTEYSGGYLLMSDRTIRDILGFDAAGQPTHSRHDIGENLGTISSNGDPALDGQSIRNGILKFWQALVPILSSPQWMKTLSTIVETKSRESMQTEIEKFEKDKRYPSDADVYLRPLRQVLIITRHHW